QLGPSRLGTARVAAVRTWDVAANWKLLVENNRECLHCHASHPEYVRATWDADRDLGRRTEAQADAIGSLRARLADAGLPTEGLNVSSVMTGDGARANRTPLAPGFVSETLDGRPAAPPMGEFARAAREAGANGGDDPAFDAFDAGVARVTVWPNFWCHASADHAAATILVPTSATTTRVAVSWLVDGEAELDAAAIERLTAFWARTSEQDWALCERQQRGVSSLGYRPGPLSPRESGVEGFLAWYTGVVLAGG
ncbi:MAG: SRPBCC family protein, partial [Planctomycetota bacterium]